MNTAMHTAATSYKSSTNVLLKQRWVRPKQNLSAMHDMGLTFLDILGVSVTSTINCYKYLWNQKCWYPLMLIFIVSVVITVVNIILTFWFFSASCILICIFNLSRLYSTVLLFKLCTVSNYLLTGRNKRTSFLTYLSFGSCFKESVGPEVLLLCSHKSVE